MGYYTNFSLKVHLLIGGKVADLVDDAPLEAVIKDLRARNENAAFALDDNGFTEERCKWYDYAVDMGLFSLKYPNILFTLSGEGEESGDIWKAYFLNGKMQLAKAEVQIAPFDPEKLK
jgi:hypothetical protein